MQIYLDRDAYTIESLIENLMFAATPNEVFKSLN